MVGILIKPDTYGHRVFDNLVRDLCNFGFRVVEKVALYLEPRDVEYLYPNECKIPQGKRALVDYLCSAPSCILILQITNSQISNGYTLLQELKGDKEKKVGLRFKYNTVKISTRDKILRTNKYYEYLMVNNFHVFDSEKDFWGFIKRKGIKLTDES